MSLINDPASCPYCGKSESCLCQTSRRSLTEHLFELNDLLDKKDAKIKKLEEENNRIHLKLRFIMRGRETA